MGDHELKRALVERIGSTDRLHYLAEDAEEAWEAYEAWISPIVRDDVALRPCGATHSSTDCCDACERLHAAPHAYVVPPHVYVMDDGRLEASIARWRGMRAPHASLYEEDPPDGGSPVSPVAHVDPPPRRG